MFTSTGSTYGVNEVLLASVLGSVVFAVFACQPLVIVGVTGPITVFNYTVYDIMKPTGVNYLAFMCWIGMYVIHARSLAAMPTNTKHQMVPHPPLDPRDNKLLQLAALRDPLPLRHLRLLRRLHLPPERHPGPRASG